MEAEKMETVLALALQIGRYHNKKDRKIAENFLRHHWEFIRQKRK